MLWIYINIYNNQNPFLQNFKHNMEAHQTKMSEFDSEITALSEFVSQIQAESQSDWSC